MKFKIKSVNSESLKSIIRSFGYALIFDRKSNQESFARRMGGGHYPRFHLYLEDQGDDVVFSLHLDQKKASYEGQHMHSAEYEGDLVESEIETLKSYILSNGFSLASSSSEEQSTNKVKNKDSKDEQSNHLNRDTLSDISNGDLDRDLENFDKTKKKKSFFFGF